MKTSFVVLLVLSFLAACSAQPTYRTAARVGQDVAVEVQTLSPDIPSFFTYYFRGRKINFFVVKVDDRVISFLDACSRCYPAKRGYHSDKDYIICRECGVRYSVSQIEQGIGSCFPIRIEGFLRDGKYLIPISVLEGMADKF